VSSVAEKKVSPKAASKSSTAKKAEPATRVTKRRKVMSKRRRAKHL
jgi:hypothetical protein